MTTLTTHQLNREPGTISRAVRDGNEVELTFHSRPYARVVPHDRIERDRAELDELRNEVQELRDRLDAAQGAA